MPVRWLPASVERIGINEESKTAMVVVNDQQLSLAIGKKGQNVRLAMKLTGWDIDIMSDTEYSKIKMEEADKVLEEAIDKRSSEEKTNHLLMGKNLSEFPVQYIKGVGPRRANLINTLGIKTAEEALYYLPYRYEDRKISKR